MVLTLIPKAYTKNGNRFISKSSPHCSSSETEENIFRRGLKQIYGKYHLTGSADEDVGFMLATLGRRKVYPAVPFRAWVD